MKKLISIIMFLTVVMTACNFPFALDGKVTFKAHLVSAKFSEIKFFEIGGTEAWYQVGNETDLWDTTWVAADFSNSGEKFRLYFEVDSYDEAAGLYTLIDCVQLQVYYSGGATGWLNPSHWDYYFDNWEGSNDAISEDGSYAIVVNDQPNEQEFHDFGFEIAEGAAILGIAVRVKGKVVKEL